MSGEFAGQQGPEEAELHRKLEERAGVRGALSERELELTYLRALLGSSEGNDAGSYHLMARKSVPWLRTGGGLLSQSSQSGSCPGKNHCGLLYSHGILKEGMHE
jgi:hypothetical protein